MVKGGGPQASFVAVGQLGKVICVFCPLYTCTVLLRSTQIRHPPSCAKFRVILEFAWLATAARQQAHSLTTHPSPKGPGSPLRAASVRSEVQGPSSPIHVSCTEAYRLATSSPGALDTYIAHLRAVPPSDSAAVLRCPPQLAAAAAGQTDALHSLQPTQSLDRQLLVAFHPP